MKTNNIAVVILAAGKGKRMNNPEIPKVLAEINHKPLIYYVLKQVKNLEPNRTVLVLGHHKELVEQYILKSEFVNIEFALQENQLGTGHAVQQTQAILSDFDGDVLILAGDVPLLNSDSLKKFINIHSEVNSDVSVLSTIAPDPTGYGRIVRDSDNNFLKIVEHKDADDDIRRIDEINSGIYIINSSILFESLNHVSNDNSQGEFYLTDIIEVLKNQSKLVYAINAAPFSELQGINTADELSRAAELYNIIYNNQEN